MENKEYYTAREAQGILGMTYSALRNQVNAGTIRTAIPPGRRQAVYQKRDVDQLKKEMHAWVSRRQPELTAPTRFVKATEDDLPELVALADAAFGGGNTVSFEKRIEWLKKNPDMYYLLKQEQQAVGYFALMPLRPEAVDDLFSQRRLAQDLTADDILSFMSCTPIDLYVMAIAVRPGASASQRGEWGSLLLLGARAVLLKLGEQGVIIRSINARSTTPGGIRLARHVGFTETLASTPGMHHFTIDVERSGLPFIMEYKAALQRSRPNHDILR